MEIVVLLAIIAVARKVILLDPTEMSGNEFGFELMGIGVIVVGLAGGYYLIKKAGITNLNRSKTGIIIFSRSNNLFSNHSRSP